ncbi:unnamed protein product [Boreogadus saida]
MDFWENIPSRKEQEAIVGRTRRAVSSRPELEDALPEWAVELLSPTVFWPESYMPVPPDFGDRPKPPRSYSQPLPPVPRYQPLPPVPSYQPLPPVPRSLPLPPVPRYQPLPPVPSYQPPPLRTIRVGVRGTGLFAYLRWSALRPCLWRSALCSCRRWPALQTIQGRHALRSCLWGPSSTPSRGGFPFKAFLQRGPALYLAFHQRGPTLDLAFHQRGPALYLSFLQRGPALHRAFLQRGPALHRALLLRGPALYLAFAGLLKGSAFPLPLLAPQAVRLRLPAMPWGSFLAARPPLCPSPYFF